VRPGFAPFGSFTAQRADVLLLECSRTDSGRKGRASDAADDRANFLPTLCVT
jgi:hypothetical protein